MWHSAKVYWEKNYMYKREPVTVGEEFSPSCSAVMLSKSEMWFWVWSVQMRKKNRSLLQTFYKTYCSLMRTFRTALDQNKDTRSNKYNNRWFFKKVDIMSPTEGRCPWCLEFLQMLMQEHWRCGYFAGEGIPESPAGQRECVTAGCPTGQVSKGENF